MVVVVVVDDVDVVDVDVEGSSGVGCNISSIVEDCKSSAGAKLVSISLMAAMVSG